MESFTFKGISSSTLGIIVKNMPLIPIAERDIENIEVPGRNGTLHIDNGFYKSKEYELECVITDNSHLDDICSLLQGSGYLTISKYPNRRWKATIVNAIPFESYLTLLQEFKISFELDPIGENTTETTITKSSSGTATITGNADVYPILTITGIGTTTINGYSVQTLESGITIDCNLMQCYSGNVAKNDKVVLDEFPILSPGNNTITLGSGITSVVIKYRGGWL